MHYTKERAAKLIAAGETIENVAKIINKDPQTVRNYYLLPEFQQYLTDHMAGTTLAIIVGYLTGDHADRGKAAIALSILKMTRAKTKAAKNGAPKLDEDETDLDEFSEEQLKRLIPGGE